jgi:Ca-activated chloride channel family protein
VDGTFALIYIFLAEKLMSFNNPNVLYLMPLLVLFWFFIRIKKNHVEDFFSPYVLKKIQINSNTFTPANRLKILLISLVFMLLALANPVVENGKITVKKQLSDLIIALDISKSMLASDIYPNRFEFAKNRLIQSLDNLKNIRIGVIGFANQSFLVAPLTDDFLSLKTLIKNLNIDNISLTGTHIFSALKTANNLLDNNTKKQVLLLTDGGDSKDFQASIQYAVAQKIKVFVFDISTKNGTTLKNKSGILKDKSGNIVIVKENPNIERLAVDTNGQYLKYSLDSTDLSKFINRFKSNSNAKDITINHQSLLFQYPLVLSLFLLFFVFFSPPSRRP